MLRLLANHLLVSLSKSSIAIVYRSGVSRHIIAEDHISWKAEKDFNWQVLIQKLESALHAFDLPARTKLSVTLSTEMVRYLTLPPQNVAMTQDEKAAYANAAYQEIYGFVTSEWIIKCHDAPPNKPILTSAIDTALFEAIQTVAKKYQFVLMSVQPYLMTVMNRLHHSLKGADAMFAVIEANRILLVNLEDGYCSQIRTYPRTENWQNTLSTLLARETLKGEQEAREILVYAPSQGKAVIPVSDEWFVKTVKVKNKKVNDAPHYAMLEALA